METRVDKSCQRCYPARLSLDGGRFALTMGRWMSFARRSKPCRANNETPIERRKLLEMPATAISEKPGSLVRTTDKPFTESIRELMDERDWSIRELGRQVRSETGWGALSTIHFMVRGDMPPSMAGLENIAKALRIRPEFFAEYRLAKLREALDPEAVGFAAAVRTMNRLSAGGQHPRR